MMKDSSVEEMREGLRPVKYLEYYALKHSKELPREVVNAIFHVSNIYQKIYRIEGRDYWMREETRIQSSPNLQYLVSSGENKK